MDNYATVARAAQHAQANDTRIDHGTARTIAALWCDPRHPETVAFSTMGMIMDGDADTLVSGLFDYAMEPGTPDRVIRGAFLAYVMDRAADGAVGPVDGWSSMWATE